MGGQRSTSAEKGVVDCRETSRVDGVSTHGEVRRQPKPRCTPTFLSFSRHPTVARSAKTRFMRAAVPPMLPPLGRTGRRGQRILPADKRPATASGFAPSAHARSSTPDRDRSAIPRSRPGTSDGRTRRTEAPLGSSILLWDGGVGVEERGFARTGAKPSSGAAEPPAVARPTLGRLPPLSAATAASNPSSRPSTSHATPTHRARAHESARGHDPPALIPVVAELLDLAAERVLDTWRVRWASLRFDGAFPDDGVRRSIVACSLREERRVALETALIRQLRPGSTPPDSIRTPYSPPSTGHDASTGVGSLDNSTRSGGSRPPSRHGSGRRLTSSRGRAPEPDLGAAMGDALERLLRACNHDAQRAWKRTDETGDRVQWELADVDGDALVAHLIASEDLRASARQGWSATSRPGLVPGSEGAGSVTDAEDDTPRVASGWFADGYGPEAEVVVRARRTRRECAFLRTAALLQTVPDDPDMSGLGALVRRMRALRADMHEAYTHALHPLTHSERESALARWFLFLEDGASWFRRPQPLERDAESAAHHPTPAEPEPEVAVALPPWILPSATPLATGSVLWRAVVPQPRPRATEYYWRLAVCVSRVVVRLQRRWLRIRRIRAQLQPARRNRAKRVLFRALRRWVQRRAGFLRWKARKVRPGAEPR